MYTPLALMALFIRSESPNDIAPHSRTELARAEQDYYERFLAPSRVAPLWKIATAFLAPPIAALTASLAWLAYASH